MLLRIVLINALVSLSIVLAIEKNPNSLDWLLLMIAPAQPEICNVETSELKRQCDLLEA